MPIFEQQFDEGWKLGAAAWAAGQPLASCPFGPGFEIPEDAADEPDPRHMAWLYAWHEGAMAVREEAAFEKGFDCALEGRAERTYFLEGDREKDHFGRGWIDALVAIQEGYHDVH